MRNTKKTPVIPVLIVCAVLILLAVFVAATQMEKLEAYREQLLGENTEASEEAEEEEEVTDPMPEAAEDVQEEEPQEEEQEEEEIDEDRPRELTPEEKEQQKQWNEIEKLISNNPAEAAALIKTWLSEE